MLIHCITLSARIEHKHTALHCFILILAYFNTLSIINLHLLSKMFLEMKYTHKRLTSDVVNLFVKCTLNTNSNCIRHATVRYNTTAH